MKACRTRFTTAAGALALVALVAVLGAAQAAPSKKVYDATVHVASGAVTETNATLTLTLKNDASSNQTLGSANFTAPAGVTPTAVARAADRPGWTAGIAGGVVTFRSISNALPKGASVSADITVGVSQSSCGSATWATRAKQSNDFSGNPGNDFALNESASNLVPLGSFTFDPIGTQVSADVFAPQIYVTGKTVTLTAWDVCGEVDSSYGTHFDDVSTLAPDPALLPARLTNAGSLAIGWTSGGGSASVAPTAGKLLEVETGDKLVVTDGASGIDATSDQFDVVEKICTSLDTTCEWQHGNGKIVARASAPPAGGTDQPDPNLGIGFNSTLNFDCNGDNTPAGDALVNINPRDYPPNSTITVTLTYEKSTVGNGPASSHSFCLSKTNGLDWNYANPVPACPSATPGFADAPCVVDQKKVTGGNLQIILFLRAEDPWGGLT
jgi:hypothetical protein